MRLLLVTLSLMVPLMLVNNLCAMSKPQPATIEGFTPLKPGEHPRLLFRKSDIPALKKRAATPEGQALVNRLKTVLGGGEAMPTVFNKNPPLNIGPKGPFELPVGAFTVSHAAGFGLLYRLTDDSKYADLARQCLDKVLAGQVDRDERYSWTSPGTGFRISGLLQAVALAYDLNYDAWPEDYRKSVVDAIQKLKVKALQGGKTYDLEFVSKGGGYPPSSNHYGAYVGGAIAALAIHGDPGADNARMEKVIASSKNSIQTLLTQGFGDYGWFGEGSGSDRTAMQPGILGLFQAFKHARGLDWAEGSSNARHIVLTRVLEMVPDKDGVRRHGRGSYAHGPYFLKYASHRDQGQGWSHDGMFALASGALPKRYAPGLRWVYENYVEPGVAPVDSVFDVNISPLQGIYAFVNWPLDSAPVNPKESWPLALHDSLHGYVLARNTFADSNDIVFTGLCRTGPVGYLKMRAIQNVMLLGFGYEVIMERFGSDGIQDFSTSQNGVTTFKNGVNTWAIDFSKAAGVDGVIISNNPAGPSVVPPATAHDIVKDGDIDLSGEWDGGARIRIKVEGEALTIDSFKKKESSWRQFGTGTLKGRIIDVQFKRAKVAGKINDTADEIHWDNGIVWTRKGKKSNWKYTDGDKLKVVSPTVGEAKITMVMFSASGTFPEPSVSGNTVTLGGQTYTVDAGGISVGK